VAGAVALSRSRRRQLANALRPQTVLAAIRKRWPWLKHLFVDAGHDRTKLMDKAAFLVFVVETVRHSDTPRT